VDENQAAQAGAALFVLCSESVGAIHFVARHLRVCIDARIADGPYQGAGAVVRSLVRALCELDDGPEDYYFLAYRDSNGWLRSFVKDSSRILLGPPAPRQSRWKSLGRNIPGLWTAVSAIPPRRCLPVSDGTIEAAGMDIVHFTMPNAFITTVPSIYVPHDLQHLHLPQFFSRRTRVRRELEYRSFCRQAAIVAAMSLPGKVDLLEHYGLAEEKVMVVPWAPAVEEYNDPAQKDILPIRKKFALPGDFVFYPAHTWPHKNHIGLLDALATLKRDYSVIVPLVCAGHQDEFFRKIKRHVAKLGLDGQVQFLGFVSADELSCLYKASRCMVFPSKFEGWGLPLMEAFLLGTPVACSDISPLREQALDAALMFKPSESEQIAAAIYRLWTDAQLRTQLAERGEKRASLFSWARTARAFRALYRKIGRCTLSDEDCSLLEAAPIV
jgi:glycosyltransferase involved in cell wall biosynthesis